MSISLVGTALIFSRLSALIGQGVSVVAVVAGVVLSFTSPSAADRRGRVRALNPAAEPAADRKSTMDGC